LLLYCLVIMSQFCFETREMECIRSLARAYFHGVMDREAREDIGAWNRGLREIVLT
jgi:hypothetical protein